MDYLVVILLLGILLLLIASGFPVAFAFLAAALSASMIILGPANGPKLIVENMFSILNNFSLTPIPMFLFMAEVLVRSGLAMRCIDAFNILLKRLPYRLSIVGSSVGALFGFLSGSAIGTTAMLGTLIYPEMRKRSYSKLMSLGPLMAAGGLAMIIPPSNLAIIYGVEGQISIGKFLVANILPGLLLCISYIAFILIYAWLRPSVAMADNGTAVVERKSVSTVFLDLVPAVVLVFLVTGLLMLGVVTPTEGAAFGAVGSLAIAAVYRSLKWDVLMESLGETIKISAMVLTIVAGSVGFSQLLTLSGISRAIVDFTTSLSLPTYGLLSAILLLIIVLGCFIDEIGIIMVAVPIFTPIINSLGVNPIWFGVLVLIALKIGLTSPPFGMLNFTMKGIIPKDVSLKDLYIAGLPFLVCDFLILAVIMAFPSIALVLPGLMK